jgi:hypothetical protein
MSETTDIQPQPRKVRIGLVPVLVLLALLVGAAIWFALSQNGGSAAPTPVASPSASAPAPAPSASTSPSVSPTAVAPVLLTPDEALTVNLGRGYELRDENGNPAELCDARRFVAPYNLDAGEPQPGDAGFSVETTEGLIEVMPYQNDADGYRGIFTAHC